MFNDSISRRDKFNAPFSLVVYATIVAYTRILTNSRVYYSTTLFAHASLLMQSVSGDARTQYNKNKMV